MSTRRVFFKELDYYCVLNIPLDATPQMINEAKKKLMKYFHPDHHGGDEFATRVFQDIQEAHTILNDPSQRRMYDLFRKKTFSDDSTRISDFSLLHLCEEANIEQLEKTFGKLEQFLTHWAKEEFARQYFKVVQRAYNSLHDEKLREVTEARTNGLRKYQHSKIIFPWELWLNLEKRASGNSNGFKTNDKVYLFGQDQNPDFCLFMGIREEGNFGHNNYARSNLLKNHPELIVIPCYIEDNPWLRAPIHDEMMGRFEGDTSGRSLNAFIIAPPEIVLYRIYPEECKVKKADMRHRGRILRINYPQKEWTDWRNKMSEEMNNEYLSHLKKVLPKQ